MYQNHRGGFRKQQSLPSQFWHSCMGKITSLFGIMAILALIAHFTRPSEERMNEEMIDNIRQCIETRDSIDTDWIDDAVANVGYIFTHADSVVDTEQMANFTRNNRLQYYRRWLYSSMHLYNNFRTEGVRCGIGVFGVVIPTVNFKDFLMRDGILRKEYNRPIIQTTGESEYFGENPDLGGVFRYNGE